MADRILVSTSEMEATITKYENARNTLQQAYQKLSSAKDHIDQCYKGPAYLALCSKWLSIYNNVRTADNAIDDAVSGLRTSIGLYEEAETTNTAKYNAQETGSASTVFMG